MRIIIIARAVVITRAIAIYREGRLQIAFIFHRAAKAVWLIVGRFAPIVHAHKAVAVIGVNRRVGLVGLAVGTLAAYGKPGDTFRFYEIDPDVEMKVVRNDAVTVDDIDAMKPEKIIISPGPCTPR